MRLDPFTSWYRVTPQASWRRLHEAGESIGHDPELDLWIIARPELVRAALADHRFCHPGSLEPARPRSPLAHQIMSAIDLPPVEGAVDLRDAVHVIWSHTPDHVDEQWGPAVRTRVRQLLDPIAGCTDTVDLVTAVAAPLPLLVTLDILGVPSHDAPRVTRWAAPQAALTWGELDDDEQIHAATGLLDLARYSQELVARKASLEVWWRCFDDTHLALAGPRSLAEAWAVAQQHTGHPDAIEALHRIDQQLRRRHPAGMDHYDRRRHLGVPEIVALAEAVAVMEPDASYQQAWERHLHNLRAPTRRSRSEQPTDLIDALLRHRDADGRCLPSHTIASLAVDFLTAGRETTTNLITHSIALGLSDPDRWQQLTDPTHAAAHVQECLRQHPPITGRLRTTNAPVTLDGITIPADAMCLLVGASNHAPDAHDADHHPHRASRPTPGATWQARVGTNLAHLEAATVLRELAIRMPHLRLAASYQHPDPASLPSLNPEHLPVTVTGRRLPADP